jgi:trimeric autotransporter adhesin
MVSLASQYDSRQLGGNDDGLITEADAVWPQLRIWVDANADGVSTYDEMRSLKSLGLTALETIPKIRKHVDAAGNVIPYWAWAAQRAKPGRALMVDVFFRVLP